jgi:CCR4-NOT complex subunit CAF16
MPAPNITTKDLTFAFPDGTSGLQNVNLTLPAGSRNLLIGGKHPTPPPFNTIHPC